MAVELIDRIQSFIGLSGDTKPTTPPIGSRFYATDTGAEYVYRGGSWVQIAVTAYFGAVVPVTDDTYWLGSDTLGWKGLKQPNTVVYEQSSTVVAVENIGTTAYRDLAARDASLNKTSADTVGAILSLKKSRGTVKATPAVVVTGDVLARVDAYGYDGANYLLMGAEVFTSEGTIAETRVPTRWAVYTATDALPSVLTERLRIDSAGLMTSYGDMVFAAGKVIKSGPTNTDTLLIAANDTTFITLTTGATDACTLAGVTLSGTLLASGTVTMPALTLGGTISGGNQNIANLGKLALGNQGITTADVLYLKLLQTISSNDVTSGARVEWHCSKTSAVYTGLASGIRPYGQVGAANNQNWTDTVGLAGVAAYTLGTTGATGTITGAAGLVSGSAMVGVTVSNLYGLYIPEDTGSSTITNRYGVYFEALTRGSTLNYMIHGATDITVGMGINIATGKTYQVNSVQVVGARQVDARIDDTPNSGDATTDGIIAALQACVQTHGLMTAA